MKYILTFPQITGMFCFQKGLIEWKNINNTQERCYLMIKNDIINILLILLGITYASCSGNNPFTSELGIIALIQKSSLP